MSAPSLFGRRLREARETRKLSQSKLADLADVNAAVISHFETGVRAWPSAPNLIKLALALQVSTDWLLGLDEGFPYVNDERICELLDRLATSSSVRIGTVTAVLEAILDLPEKNT